MTFSHFPDSRIASCRAEFPPGHADGFSGIEITVAHSAEADAFPDQLILSRQAQHPVLHTGSHDHSFCVPLQAVIREHPFEVPVILNPNHFRQVHFRALVHDLVQQGFRVFISAHLRRTRPVFHLGTVGNLSAEAVLLQHQRVFSVPLRVQRGCHPRGTSADHDNIRHFTPIL